MCQNSVALSSDLYRFGSPELGDDPVKAHKQGVLSLVDRATRTYSKLGKEFAEYGTTLHGIKQYVHPEDRTIHTNTVEGALSIFQRGMKSVYQHCGEQHLHRHLAEFEFRYNHRVAIGVDDRGRAARPLGGIVGKRITYAAPNERA